MRLACPLRTVQPQRSMSVWSGSRLQQHRTHGDVVGIKSTALAPTVKPVYTTPMRLLSSATSSDLGAQYQKKSQREHILLRPEPYQGAIDLVTERQWILTSPFLPEHEDVKSLDLSDTASPRIVESDVTFNPALYKIVDEILVNSADNVHRNNGKTKMTYIDVQVDPVTGFISVENNGASIPVVMHQEEQCYVPELIFGHLLTSSNYNDSEARFTGGRHGYGAKLTNIYSSKFTVDVLDSEHKLYYSQVFRDNMSICETPTITDSKSVPRDKLHLPNDKNGNLTRISFTPDFTKFPGVAGLDASMVRLIHRRVVDLAASLGNKGVKVYLNNVCVPVNSLQKYMKLCPIFIGEGNHAVEDDISNSGSSNTEGDSEDSVDLADANTIQNKGKMLFFDLNEHWSIAVGPRHDDDPHTFSSMRQLSFVNNISTGRGGTHVNYISDIIARAVCNYMNDAARKKRWKITTDITPGQVKSRMSLMVSCTISNPAFDSQTKELLMTPIRPPGSNMYNGKGVEGVRIDESILNNICKNSGLIGLVTEYVQTKETRDVARKMDGASRGRLEKNKQQNIEKLEDAHLAGGNDSEECTLILTEGDSAKALALSGLAVLGRQKFGVFPLKGKLLNVRDASVAQLSANKEVQDLMQILGIRRGDVSGLRYGHIVVMADQDHDGSHIKGLLLNLVQVLWPELQQRKAFQRQFVTPIVKATYTGSGPVAAPCISGLNLVTIKREQTGAVKVVDSGASTGVTAATLFDGKTLSFYSLSDYALWRAQTNDTQKYRIKYYKGLGTSTSQEGREYFSLLQTHLIDFIYATSADSDALQLAFAKDLADARKEWVQGAREGVVEAVTSTVSADSGLKQVTVRDFVHHELVQFSLADNMRSIPSLVDGLKPGQRKIQFGCLKRNLTKEVKVAQLSGYIAEHTAYHHGEQSLNATIVALAQQFPFSNNLSLLEPLGQFGTRSMGGKDSASSRYIFTKLAPVARKLFRAEDDVVLSHNLDDGLQVEPKTYFPILPLVLVNGTVGIGTGYSSSIPSYHPKDLIQAVKARLSGKTPSQLVPYAHGYVGQVVPETVVPSEKYADGTIAKFMTYGQFTLNHKKNSVHITELPWGMWNTNYKQFLISLLETTKVKKGTAAAAAAMPKKTGPTITNFTEHHTENTVAFTLYFKKDDFVSLLQTDVMNALKLSSSITTTNMHQFNDQGQIEVYKDPRDIIDNFVQVRLSAYAERKARLLVKMQLELALAKSKVLFVQLVSGSKLQLAGKKKEVLARELFNLGILPFNVKNADKEVDADAEDLVEAPTKGQIIIDTTYSKEDILNQYNLDASHHSGIPLYFQKKQVYLHANAFDYLLSMPISSLTKERADAIQADATNVSEKVELLQKSSPQDLWLAELRELEDYLDKSLKFPDNANCLVRKAEEARKNAPESVSEKSMKPKKLKIK